MGSKYAHFGYFFEYAMLTAGTVFVIGLVFGIFPWRRRMTAH
jgi:hypothetical protein